MRKEKQEVLQTQKSWQEKNQDLGSTWGCKAGGVVPLRAGVAGTPPLGVESDPVGKSQSSWPDCFCHPALEKWRQKTGSPRPISGAEKTENVTQSVAWLLSMYKTLGFIPCTSRMPVTPVLRTSQSSRSSSATYEFKETSLDCTRSSLNRQSLRAETSKEGKKRL